MSDVKNRLTTQDDDLAGMLLDAGMRDVVRYDHIRSRWLLWNGVRWRPDNMRGVYDLIRLTADRMWAETDDGEGERRKRLLPLFNWAKKESVLKAMSAREGIAMSGNEWDTEPYLLGFENGVLDLRTRTFNAHPSPTLYMSKSVGIDWDPEARAPMFANFVKSIMSNNDDLVAYLMTLLGYSLFGLQTEQKFWMWVGRGANGKGVLARTMVRALGDYAETPADTLYMRTRSGAAPSSAARPELVRLQGVRFTYMSEPQGGQFNEEMLKAHTGDDVVLARDLYAKAGQFAEFLPTHKIIFLTNDPPRTDDAGVSMRRRARVIRFEEDYTGDRGDKLLEDRLKTEKAGILALLTAYAVDWWNGGEPDLPEPVLVTQWSNDYIEENDPLARFIKDDCVQGPNEKGNATLLYSAYEDWSARNGVEPKSQTSFGREMIRRYRRARTMTGAVYHGIRPKGAMEAATSG